MFAKWQDERLHSEILFLEGRLEALSGDNGQANRKIRFMFHSIVTLDLHLIAPGFLFLSVWHGKNERHLAGVAVSSNLNIWRKMNKESLWNCTVCFETYAIKSVGLNKYGFLRGPSFLRITGTWSSFKVKRARSNLGPKTWLRKYEVQTKIAKTYKIDKIR